MSDFLDSDGDRRAQRFGRSGASFQLAKGLGQTALLAKVGAAKNCRVPIGCNRVEILAKATGTVTLLVRRRQDQPEKEGAAELVILAASLALTATATGRAVLELPPDCGTVDCAVTAMAGAVTVDAVAIFWRQP